MVHAPGDLDGVVVLAHLVRTGAVDDDHHFAGVSMRPPEPVAVMAADGGGKIVA